MMDEVDFNVDKTSGDGYVTAVISGSCYVERKCF
jgi:hypothetical protein